jgi:Protein of unknown function (DUF2846)
MHYSFIAPATVMMISTLMLSGCSHIPFFGAYSGMRSDPDVIAPSKLPQYDAKQPTIKEQFKVQNFSLGSWAVDRFRKDQGALFQPVPVLDQKFALIYFYRPQSRWAESEIIAASIFLNGLRLPSLLNNSYYWLELMPGTYRLKISRPLGFIYFQKGTIADIKVEAGKTYYLRYDEQNYRGRPDPALGLFSAGPLAQLPEKDAMPELSLTTLKTPGYSFADNPDEPVFSTQEPNRDNYKSFNGLEGKPVPNNRLEKKGDVSLGVKMRWWNPFTW